MLFETKYLDTNDNEEYVRDRQGQEMGFAQKAAVVAGVAALGVGAYRSGALRGVIKHSTEAISNHYKGRPTSILRGTKKWLKSETDSTTESIFRANSIGELKERIFTGDTISSSIATKRDLSNWAKSISKEFDISKAQNSAKKTMDTSNSSLFGNMKEILKTMAEVDNLKGIDKTSHSENIMDSINDIFKNSSMNSDLRKKMVDEVINMNNISDSRSARDLKRKGYRHLKVKDVFEQTGNNKINVKKDWAEKLKSMGLEDDSRTSREFLESFFLNQNNGGKSFDDIKHMKFDNNLLMDAKGNLLDSRQFQQDLNWSLNSLANDYAFPFVKMNPLKVFNIDKHFSEKTNFAVLTGKQAGITGNLKNVAKDNPFVYVNSKVYDSMSGDMIADNIELINQKSGMAQTHLRKIWGLEVSKREKFRPKDGKIKYTGSKAAEFFNFGLQDTPTSNASIFSPMTWPSFFTEKLSKVFPSGKVTEEIKPGLVFQSGKYSFQKDQFVGVKKGIGIKDITEGDKTVGDFFAQFIAGRRNADEKRINSAFGESLRKSSSSVAQNIGNYMGEDNLEDVTTHTLGAFRIVNSLNEALSTSGLGFSVESTGSTHSIFRELILKRYAPVAVGITAWNYLNYESDNIFGVQPEDKIADAYANIDVGLARVRDKVGLTDFGKKLDKLTPGSEHITDIPFLGALDWTETAEERRDYWETGEDAVRKGRYWGLGNTPFTGGKTEYYRPNWVRRVKSDWEYTDTKWGSRQEYFENHWLPTPSHPLAPVRRFMTDKYHYEEKHYEERPYMITGTVGNEIPFIGPLFGATIGKLIKPERKMHLEYWDEHIADENIPVQPEQEDFFIEDTVTPIMVPKTEGHKVLNVSSNVAPVSSESNTPSMWETFQNKTKSLFQKEETPPLVLSSIRDVPETPNEFNEIAAISASGGINLYRTDNPFDISELNENIKTKSLQRASRDFSTSRIGDVVDVYDEYEDDYYTEPEEAPLKNPFGAKRTTEKMFSDLTLMAGIRGYSLKEAIGVPFEDGDTIASSNYMLQSKDNFWNLNLGGLGGNISEIGRRLVPKERFDDEKFNPIENRMPDWIPGEDYFIDFTKGDPYKKVQFGEIRMPGYAYEAVNNIDSDSISRADVDISMLTRNELDIYKSILNEPVSEIDGPLDSDSRWHKSWKERMVEHGIAYKTDVEIVDPETSLKGTLDMYGDNATIAEYLLSNAIEVNYFSNKKMSLSSGDIESYYKLTESIDMTDESEKGIRKQEKSLSVVAQKILEAGEDTTVTVKRNKTPHGVPVQHDDAVTANVFGNILDTDLNYVIHAGSENPEDFVVNIFETNKKFYNDSVSKSQEVQSIVRNQLETGELKRGDMYSYFDRFKILADVAPYSDEFREYKSVVGQMDLTEEEQEQYRRINEQVSDKKDPLRLNPYKFRTANIHKTELTVTRVANNNMFYTEEYGDNPIRLAGLHVPTGANDERAEEAQKFLRQIIREGSKINVGVNADSLNLINNDTYKSIDAVIYNKHGKNINRELLEQDLANEKENDYSATGVHARFSESEIAFGRAYESFAHRDTVAHTKFLQVRSGLESYKRRHLYGQDFQTWSNPVRDYLKPAFDNAASKNPIVTIGMGALIGSAFGRGRFPHEKAGKVAGEAIKSASSEWKYGRLVGAAIGATVAGIGVARVKIHEKKYDEEWIPERRQKEREINEYVDMLKYIKNRKLYEEFADLALEKEGFDVREYINLNKEEGDERKDRRRELEEAKRDLHRESSGEGRIKIINNLRKNRRVKRTLREIREEIDPVYLEKGMDEREALRAINRELRENAEHREAEEISPIAAEAIKYYNESKATMYGYEEGDPISNILQALPKTERMYMQSFMEAPMEERMEILSLVPRYMRRPLASSWGLEPEERISLDEYFKEKQLPGENWVGWSPNVDLDSVKVKLVQTEGLNKSDFNIWDNDVEKANATNIPIPHMDFDARSEDIRKRLHELLGSSGVKDLQINITPSERDSANMNLSFDQRAKYEQAIEEQQRRLLI